MPRRVLLLIAAGLIAAVLLVYAVYLADMDRTYERVRANGTVVPSIYGDIEYTEGGSGPDVLVIHGSGGGYDQAELLVQAVLGDQFHWIAPSRFGYLRSTFHEGATWDEQAHAYVYLLDQLGVEKAAVVAMSHGGPSALIFALLHPERVSSLTLISCGVAPSAAPDQAKANWKGDMLTAVYRHDLYYWALTKLFRKQFMGLMGASEAVIESLTAGQMELADRIIDYMNPVSLRAAGVFFDNKAILPGGRIAGILAPTLIFHAKDDGLQLFHNAEFAASNIPGARLVSFERGGHLLVIVERLAIRKQLAEHILGRKGNLQVSDILMGTRCSP
jgi:pimeloyl-ACP methyl ester carboxylesterase